MNPTVVQAAEASPGVRVQDAPASTPVWPWCTPSTTGDTSSAWAGRGCTVLYCTVLYCTVLHGQAGAVLLQPGGLLPAAPPRDPQQHAPG